MNGEYYYASDFPDPLERDRAGLRDVALGKIKHRYQGECPDEVNGDKARDPNCRACREIGYE